jgi:hypothetical protein
VRIISTEQEFNQRAKKIIDTHYFLGLPSDVRSAFVGDIERARSFEKLTMENRFIWKRAEAEIKRKEIIKK